MCYNKSMQILSIKLKSKNNPNIFAIYSSNGEYILHSDIIVKYGIKLGEVNDENFLVAISESNVIIALDYAVKYIANTIKTVKQVKDYLKKKGFNDTDLNKVIQKLEDYNLLNDEMFAKNYILANKSFSKIKLKQKLIGFGVKNDTISNLLDEIDEVQSCKVRVEKFIKNKVLDAILREKLIRRLTYQGYKWDTIRTALNELNIKGEDL